MGPKSAMTDMPRVDRGQRITVTISILEVSQNVQKHHNPIDGHSKEENPEPHSRLNVYRKTNLHPLLLEAEKKRRQTEQEGEGHAGDVLALCPALPVLLAPTCTPTPSLAVGFPWAASHPAQHMPSFMKSLLFRIH